MVMKAYEVIWENDYHRTFILSSSFAMVFFLIDMVLLFWSQEDLETYFPFLFDGIPDMILYNDIHADIIVVDIIHVVLWCITFLFCFVTYANLKEFFQFRTDWLDLCILIILFVAVVFLFYGLWVSVSCFIILLIEVFCFIASIGVE